MQIMQAKFDGMIQDVPTILNKRYMKMFALQPEG
jgi:hypothetical protein